MSVEIDIDFDMRDDTPASKDPDAESPTLRRYHAALWSKPLPDGTAFTLDASLEDAYLRHASPLGDFRLASDSIIHTYRRDGMRDVLNHFTADEIAAFVHAAYTIGGFIVFPGNRVGGEQTINQARGMCRKIGDRFDLTLECIRRHYSGEHSPLAGTLGLYPEFFALFRDFSGYCDFFLLQDLLTEDGGVKFMLEFDEFESNPLPTSADQYAAYRDAAMAFVEARNRRIQRFAMSRCS
jgi:hypothetical protein